MTAGAETETELLREGCAALGVDLTTAQREVLLRYLDLLYVWNRTAGLTTIPRDRAVRLHLLDSLAAAEAVMAGPCLDLGTGAGLPGLVLAVAKPSVPFVLVESNRRKCSFLLETVRSAALANVRIVQADYEDLPAEERYPTVVSRAFRPPAEFLAIAQRLVEPDGRVVLLLADADDEELASLGRDTGFVTTDCRRLRLPGGGEPRTIAGFSRTS